MKTHKRSLNIRKQFRNVTPAHKLWNYTQETTSVESHVHEKNPPQNDRFSILKDDFRYSLVLTEKRASKECQFVVDWQLEDVY
jgi:hypothetical protein